MKTFLILGAGTAGTMVANKMADHLDQDEWKIILVDQHETHYYQPGFLFIPFGIYSANDVIKPKRDFIPQNVEFVLSEIKIIEPEKNQVQLVKENRTIKYDTLVLATGARTVPEETEGMLEDLQYKSGVCKKGYRNKPLSDFQVKLNHKKSKIPAILREIDDAAAVPTIDHWLFDVNGQEAEVFPSGVASGEYFREIQNGLCR